jgi:NAD+ diphosphatase
MLHTPASFLPLLVPQEHPAPHTFIFRGDELLIREADLTLPSLSICAAVETKNNDLHPVGLLGDCYCRTTWLDRNAAAPAGFTFKNLRALFGAMDEQLLSVAGRAFQIAHWARTHRYCGTCANVMELVPGERCYRCQACAMMAYPRISPAMMVLIKKGDAILLARHTASPTKRFSPLAGFLEAGESVEDAVHREVFEEVGLTISNLQYFGSQSWPFPHSLMIAFTAEYAGGEISVDQNEIAEARWFGPADELPEYTVGVSISGELINAHRPAANVATTTHY